MRNVVVMDDVHESDIRPNKLMNNFTKLIKGDINRLLKNRSSLVSVPCPGCHSSKRKYGFKKFGCTYQECLSCRTVYMSPRPTRKAMALFYEKSTALQFWDKAIITKTAKERDDHIYRPRVEWLFSSIRRYFEGRVSYADIHPKYLPILQRIPEGDLVNSPFAIEASPMISKSLEKSGYTLVKESLSDLGKESFHVSVVTAFEVLDRIHDPKAFVKNIHTLLSPGGIFLLTTRSGSGFDLQILWDQLDNILPMIHMNLLSVEGIQELLKTAGFEIVELSTPGRLDVEIVRQKAKDDKKLPLSRFMSTLVRQRDVEAHQAFQEFLQQFRLSSHMRLVAKKGNHS